MNNQDLKIRIESVSGKIIEICGPTPPGYRLLKKLGIKLPTLITTNIENPVIINPFGDSPKPYSVDELQDIRHLTYEDESVGMILVSYLPKYDQKDTDYLAEYNHLDTPKHNLHIFLYKESARVLQKGGLLIQVCPFPLYEKAASHYNLRVVFEDKESETVVFEKI